MKSIQVGDVVGDYKVIDIAGSGGMGSVYKIEHLITRRIEAMKLLPPGWSEDPEEAHRFKREIQLQARLQHPNIVTLYNAVRHDDSMALIMEFVEGDTLQHMLDWGPLKLESAVDYAIQVLGALSYAHAAGVVHRDVSPANIIVTREGVAKLTDFGLARGEGDLRLSTSSVPVGSPWYMSPEQVKCSRELDARTDLYAVGAVLHEMLTGRKLFEAVGAFAVMRAQVEAEPQRPGAINANIPGVLDQIVGKALAKDPAQRFASAGDFRIALEGVKTGAATRRVWGLRPWRVAVFAALVPAALAAGYYTGGKIKEAQAPAPVPRKVVVAPAPIPKETPPVVAPPPTVVVEPAEPAPAPAPEHRAVKPVQRAARKERDTALRVTGQESQTAATAPAVHAPEPELSKPVFVEAPETPLPVAEKREEPPAPTATDPQSTGNRLVRALGKVNPFRKRTKPDTKK